MTRSLIEQWLPVGKIGAESLRERGASSALPPINFLHVWWARRPLTVSRAAVVASLLPAWPSDEDAESDPRAAKVLAGLRSEFPDGVEAYRDWFVQTLGILGDPVRGRKLIAAARETGAHLPNGGYGYRRAFTVSPENKTIERLHRLTALRADIDQSPAVLDPFAGGGSIPLEAARYGCTTTAKELNPVAVAILHGTVGLPAHLGPGFTPVLRRYGDLWAKRIEQQLRPFFPKQPDDTAIIAYIWAHTVPCPTTGLPTPLAPDFWLARGKAGRDVAIKLDVDAATGAVERTIIEGKAASQFGNRSTYKQGSAVSIWSTDTTFDGDYIRAQAKAERMGAMLLAVSVTRPGVRGRQFRAPSQADLDAVKAASHELRQRLPQWEIEDLVPTEPIDPVSNYERGHRMYGIERWRDFFSDRQLLTNATALEALHRTIAEAQSEIGEEAARSLALYLAFAVDKTIDYNSRQASWDATRLKVRSTFDKHNFNFKWSFAEFDGASAIVPWAVDQVVDAYRGIAKLVERPTSLLASGGSPETHIVLGSATDPPPEDASVDAIVTDPPYYDNVLYAEISDFFYVWLKRSLRHTWPELCRGFLTDKEREAVANRALYLEVATTSSRGTTKSGKTAADLADEHYERLLTESFHQAHRVLKDDGVLTVMFTHKRVDAWDTLGAALLEAGFEISSSWPVHTESEHSLHQAKKNAATSTILLTCRPRVSTESAWWEDLKAEVKQVARSSAQRFADQGITGVDLSIATYGPALSVLSRNWPVYTGQLDEGGNREVLRPDVALDLAREEVADLKRRGLLGGREVDFDRPTDWWLLAWNDFQAAQFPFDEARKLSIAMRLEVDDLVRQHRLIKASAGYVTLLTPAQRRTAGGLDPDAQAWSTVVDHLHALMLTYEEEGLAAADAWLQRSGKGDDPDFRSLVEAALHAVPRVKDQGEFVRAEARVLEGLRATLFPEIPPPPDPEHEIVEQLALVET